MSKPRRETWYYKRERDALARVARLRALGFPGRKRHFGNEWIVTLRYKLGKHSRVVVVKDKDA